MYIIILFSLEADLQHIRVMLSYKTAQYRAHGVLVRLEICVCWVVLANQHLRQ